MATVLPKPLIFPLAIFGFSFWLLKLPNVRYLGALRENAGSKKQKLISNQSPTPETAQVVV
jgi:hypothetical protein